MGRRYHSNKQIYWLRWDGSFEVNGKLNTADDAAVGPAANTAARNHERHDQRDRRRALRTLIIAQGHNPFIVPIHISVRILTLEIQPGVVQIPVQIKNPGQVRGLLLRVYDKADNPIYHEYIALPAGPHGVLPQRALAEAAARTAPFQPNPAPRVVLAAPPLAAHASTGHSLCRVEVWVSREAGVLSNKTIADRLGRDFNVYTHTVSNEYQPTPHELSRKRKGYGDVWASTGQRLWSYLSNRAAHAVTQNAMTVHLQASQVKRAQKVADGVYLPRALRIDNGKPCVRIVMDKRATSELQNFTIAARINDIRAQIQEAEDALNAEPIRTTRDDELRVFLAPEWYFRKSNNADVNTNAGEPSYDHAEFLDIVQRCKALSAQFPDWLIVPGTIYWTLQYATRLHTWGAAEMNALQNDIVNSYAVPMAAGNNGVARAAVVNPQTCFNGNVALFLSNGAVVHYVYKQNAGEAEWQGHEYLTSTYLRQEHHLAVFRRSYFRFRGVLFGIDICRDHYEHRCFYERSGQLAAIRTDYLNEYANARADVLAEIAALGVLPKRVVLRAYLATLLGMRQRNAAPAAPGAMENLLIGDGLLPAAAVVAAGLPARQAAIDALIVQITADCGVHPGIDGTVQMAFYQGQHGAIDYADAGSQATSDTMVNAWTEHVCGRLRVEEQKAVAIAPHIARAQNLLNVVMNPLLLTGPQVAAGVVTIGGQALDPPALDAGDLDVMLIISKGTPNRQYGALNVAQWGLVAQCDGATVADCVVQQIDAVADIGAPVNTRPACAVNMAGGGRALAAYDIVSIMFDVNASQKQAQLDVGNVAVADQHFAFERDFLMPLFQQIAPNRKALTDQLLEHAPRVTHIVVPSQAQAAVANSFRFDDANVDREEPPTGRGGTLLARNL